MAKRRKTRGAAESIGGMLAGFDYQVFRTTPPPHELVHKGDRLPAVPAEGGGTLSIDLPRQPAEPDPDAADG